MILLKGSAAELLPKFCEKNHASVVLWNRSYDPTEAHKIKSLVTQLKKQKIEILTFQGNVLCAKEELLKADATPYLVYTPFWNNFVRKYKLKTRAAPEVFPKISDALAKQSLSVDQLGILPEKNWHEKFAKHWVPGEEQARKILKKFCEQKSYDLR